MKLLHLGDLHLGKTLGEFDLYDDQKFILDRILELIDIRKIDGVLIAGDVYDKSIPSEAAINLLDYFLSELASRKVFTYMISGNHDSDDRLNFGSGLFESNRIFISSIYDGNLRRYTWSEGNEEVNIYLLPFVKASRVKSFYPEDSIETYDDAVRAIIRHSDIDKEKSNILVAHQFVAGRDKDPEFGGSESVGAHTVGLVEKIAYDCFDDFDYVALGHIHSPQKVGREEVRYSGSPLKYSLSEVNNLKSVPIITIAGKGRISIDIVPLKPKRDLRHITGYFKDLLAKENVTGTDDFIYVTLKDNDFVNNAMGIFQQTYPHTVKIDYDNEHTKEADRVDLSGVIEKKTFDEVIGEFYKEIYGCDISEEEMSVMRQVAGEAGVFNETD